MELLKLILHTNGNEKCLKNVVNYPIGGSQVMQEGFGVDPYNSEAAANQFIQTTKYWNNQGKTPVFHFVTSFTNETAKTADEAMALTKEIFAPVIDSHQTIIGIHNKEHENSSYHSHTVICPTDYKNGNMMYGDNNTNFALAQRVADVTGQSVRFALRKENESEWECSRVFNPKDVEECNRLITHHHLTKVKSPSLGSGINAS